MGMIAVVLMSALGLAAIPVDDVRWFPGGYFHSHVRDGFQRRVMESWPGPSAVLSLWSAPDLSEDQRVALLLGAAVYHDPLLLPMYSDALAFPSQRLRQAAAYGYRDLLVDQLPDVSDGVSDQVAEQLRDEMIAVSYTLQRESLLELWLQAALVLEGSQFPGWDGVTFERPLGVCLRAIEVLAETEDLDLLVKAFRESDNLALRTNLVKIIEAVTLSRFLIMPANTSEGWGPEVFQSAINSLEDALPRWSGAGCSVDGEAVLRSNLADLGVPGVDPFAPEACVLWVNVLDRGYPRWWMMASKRLFACGGPWIELSALNAESEGNEARRTQLLEWFRPLTVAGMPRPRSPRQGRP